jgi:hypothetical protein
MAVLGFLYTNSTWQPEQEDSVNEDFSPQALQILIAFTV